MKLLIHFATLEWTCFCRDFQRGILWRPVIGRLFVRRAGGRFPLPCRGKTFYRKDIRIR